MLVLANSNSGSSAQRHGRSSKQASIAKKQSLLTKCFKTARQQRPVFKGFPKIANVTNRLLQFVKKTFDLCGTLQVYPYLDPGGQQFSIRGVSSRHQSKPPVEGCPICLVAEEHMKTKAKLENKGELAMLRGAWTLKLPLNIGFGHRIMVGDLLLGAV